MRGLVRLGFWLALGLSSSATLAGEPAHNPPDKPKPDRVHLGATSVTVVDEHEAVDDVISRIRRAEKDSASGDKPKTDHDKVAGTSTKSGQSTGEARAALRAQKDRNASRADPDRVKEQKRERAATTRTRMEQKQRR